MSCIRPYLLQPPLVLFTQVAEHIAMLGILLEGTRGRGRGGRGERERERERERKREMGEEEGDEGTRGRGRRREKKQDIREIFCHRVV